MKRFLKWLILNHPETICRCAKLVVETGLVIRQMAATPSPQVPSPPIPRIPFPPKRRRT